MRIFYITIITIFIQVTITLSQDDPFPSTEEVAEAQAGELILKSGMYLKYEADYGILVAPENRQKPDSRLIHIPVIRIRSKNGKARYPIFYFTGGPGNPNVYTDNVYKNAGLDDLSWPWILELNDISKCARQPC